MVKPSVLSLRITLPICWTMTGARPSVGSSRSSRRAPVRRMRPMASICCSPPERRVPWLRSRSLRFGKSSNTCAVLRPPSRTSGGRRRFSSTFRLAKMPRSSGQSAIPCRALRYGGSAIVSTPSTVTEPVRRGTIPMIDFIVVVLPAPLRTTRVTSSTLRTSTSTPWRTWDSPYQAWSLPTESSASGMLRPQIGGDHGRILRDAQVVAFGEHLAAGEHGDALGEAGDHAEVVLDHQHRSIVRHALDQRRDALHVLVPHARRRLIEEHELRIEGQRGGDLQRTLAAVGELRRDGVAEIAQPHRREQLGGAAVELAQHPVALPEVEGGAPLALQRDAHVLERREIGEDGADLERAYQSLARHVGGRGARDVLALVRDGAAGRRQEAGEQVEAGGLARAVRADQRVDGPADHPEVDALHRDEPAELLRQPAGLENHLGVGHAAT